MLNDFNSLLLKASELRPGHSITRGDGSTVVILDVSVGITHTELTVSSPREPLVYSVENGWIYSVEN